MALLLIRRVIGIVCTIRVGLQVFYIQDPHWGIHNMQFGDNPVTRNDRPVPDPWAIIQAVNLYLYCMHNPVMFIDPSGLDFITVIITLAKKAAPHVTRVGNWFSAHAQRFGHWVGGLFGQGSRAAAEISVSLSNFTVSNKHLQNAGGNWARFSTNSATTVNQWLGIALRSAEAVVRADPNPERIQMFVDMGMVIGTKGERIIKIVINEAGNIVTSYPVRNMPS